MKKITNLITALFLTGLVASGTVLAANHTVTARGLAFAPIVINVAPGDTVYWDNMATHNVHMMERNHLCHR
mgnify:CR=1 FL=1